MKVAIITKVSVIVSLLCLITIAGADIIVESGIGGLNRSYYYEVGSRWFDSTSKSTAEGLTPGILSRFVNLQTYPNDRDTAVFRPYINTAGNYQVFVSWNLGNASTVRHTIYYSGGTAIQDLLQDGYGQSTPSNANIWIPLGTYNFASGTSGRVEVTSTYVSGRPGPIGNYRVYADAVKWVWADAPVTPVAAFTGTPTTGQTPLTVSFTDNSLNNPTSWFWDFGDGTTSTVQNPQHTYSTVSAITYYTVKLIVSNSAGTSTTIKTNYIRVTAPSSPPPIAIDSVTRTGIIVDNLDSGFSYFGAWSLATAYGQWASNYRLATTVNNNLSNATARWRPTLPDSKKYNVYVWYPATTNRVLDARYRIYYSGGNETFYVNQTVNYGGWFYLGCFSFASGTTGYVELTNATRTSAGSYWVGADAVMFEAITTIIVDDSLHYNNQFKITGSWSVSTSPQYFYSTTARYVSAVTSGLATRTAIWRPHLPANGIYQVEVCYPSEILGQTLAKDAKFTVYHKTGYEPVIVPQYAHGKFLGGHWFDLGVFAFDSGTTGYVELTNLAPESNGRVVAADAVRFTTYSPLPAREGGEFRAFWAHGINVMGLRSIQEVTAMIDTARMANYNAIIVHGRVAGDAYYDSAYEPKSSALGANTTFDAISACVAYAHDTSGGKPYIEVHLWMNPYRDYRTDMPPTDTTMHLFYLHPEWIDQTYSGTTLVNNMMFTNPAIPDNQDYHIKVWMDAIRNYDVDGIHTDDYFYQGSSWGYNTIAISRFSTEFGYYPSTNDANHGNWRRQEVTSFVRRVYAESLTIKPHIKWSKSPVASGSMIPYTSSAAYASGFSDWIDWLKNHYIDAFVPEVYTGFNSTFTTNVWFSTDTAKAYGRHNYVGLACYSQTTATIMTEINYCQNSAKSHGTVCFTYHQQTPAPIDNPGFYSIITTVVFAKPTTTPAMPWKSNPPGGILKGVVGSNLAPYKFYSGKSLYKALVTYTGPYGSGSTYTDGCGYYCMFDVPYGVYTVTAYPPPGVVLAPVSVPNVQIIRGVPTRVDLFLDTVPVELSAFTAEAVKP
ncbi:MAG: family 10 glycosylhydrolase [bacterium]|nr:family 10 glycosylhydrolase [bacterium]